ncbi:hypothetical protein IGI04_023251 [Brassica rapa subsp. trilocularis]|uniref:Uncharacterized protein n=1 Tax=Brassica rapa subsp. trilocularis TaxID=1813537 RepID=A0ABQ7M3A3_BRACM|nr:hypothetical protein IGI04_023251 [Brassica rapa subsp. trilocularis]
MAREHAKGNVYAHVSPHMQPEACGTTHMRLGGESLLAGVFYIYLAPLLFFIHPKSLKDVEFFKGGHSGLSTPLRSVGIRGYLRNSRKGFGRGFGQGPKPQRTKHNESRKLIADLFSCRFSLIGSCIMAGGRYRVVPITCQISNARLVFWVLRGKEDYVSMSLRGLAERLHKACSIVARKVTRVCPYAAGQRGFIKHVVYGEVARKHAPSCDTLLGLHVSSLDVLARVPLWLRRFRTMVLGWTVSHVLVLLLAGRLAFHLQPLVWVVYRSCSCLIVGRWVDLCLERFGSVTNMNPHLSLHVRQFGPTYLSTAARIASLHESSLAATPQRSYGALFNLSQQQKSYGVQ